MPRLTASIDLPQRDLPQVKPVSASVVEAWRRLLYTFDHGDLHAKIEAVSMFERADGLKADFPDMTTVWRDHVIMWSKDTGRSIDYLESRADIAKGKIGHIALSSDCTPLTLAVGGRISLAVIFAAASRGRILAQSRSAELRPARQSARLD